jgi:DNA adenine methylase
MIETVKPVLKYFGAKFLLRDWIIDQFPEHECYCEPFGGSAAILLNKPRAKIEYYNDLDGEVTNFFLVLRDQLPAFLHLLKRTPYSRETFHDECAREGNTTDPVRRAWAFHLRCWQGVGLNRARQGSGWRAHGNLDGSGGHNAAALYAGQLRRVVIASQRLRGVHIENRDAMDVARMVDSPSTLHYMDPPYLAETRADQSALYKHELLESDGLFGGGHKSLLEQIQDLKGSVILSGYQSDLYDQTLRGWKRIEKQTRDNKRRERTECLWLNPRAMEAA